MREKTRRGIPLLFVSKPKGTRGESLLVV